MSCNLTAPVEFRRQGWAVLAYVWRVGESTSIDSGSYSHEFYRNGEEANTLGSQIQVLSKKWIFTDVFVK